MPRISDVGDNGSDGPTGSFFAGGSHEDELHKVVVDCVASRLYEEDVSPADRVQNLHCSISVAELGNDHPAELDAQVHGNFSGELRVSVAAEYS